MGEHKRLHARVSRESEVSHYMEVCSQLRQQLAEAQECARQALRVVLAARQYMVDAGDAINHGRLADAIAEWESVIEGSARPDLSYQDEEVV